jgi:hypothetical protein
MEVVPRPSRVLQDRMWRISWIYLEVLILVLLLLPLHRPQLLERLDPCLFWMIFSDELLLLLLLLPPPLPNGTSSVSPRIAGLIDV